MNGKFENYFNIFRKKVLPLIHNKKTIKELLEKKTKEERYEFYNKKWNNFRWKLLFKIFFSKYIMGKFGRDKAFFRYVNTKVSENILNRTRYALTELDTSENSYLHYIINGKYEKILPIAYRKENFNMIKENIDKIIILSETVEGFLEKNDTEKINKYNLSDIFEYMSDDEMCNIFKKILNKSPIGTKVVYWNMLSPKRASKYFEKLLYKEEEAKKLFKEDKAFFYSDFIIEEIK
ncbi:MAG: DUF3419 family protein [Clostridia bacterium]|jgi:S-adenosylmethionine-diacylglycerol 3-amino-3-carboxypropyl transferase|nr:DUF3419 family protein [Clostridia bacterium]